jgi:hypothetical protein
MTRPTTVSSGVSGFEDMGEHWVSVRSAARDGTLRQGDSTVRQVAERWEQFVEYLCLSFSQELGRNVAAPCSRKQTTSGRLDEVEKALAAAGMLEATLRVPDAIGDLHVHADLKARQTSLSVSVSAHRRATQIEDQLAAASADRGVRDLPRSAPSPIRPRALQPRRQTSCRCSPKTSSSRVRATMT